ncbi:MAG TPA: ABC transporter ATP-binding protein [Solirubrobacterales bacterium]|nr:ABC transporter ATP-binding protein [Solirubrobacterales bacterium]
MSVENAIAHKTPADALPPPPAAGDPLAIQVEGLSKSFRIPTHRVDSLKERVVRPFSSPGYRELNALKGISFEIRQGEFFGIVGRNGSGKSTLLKLLASIYRPDAGRIRIAGRLAPFIELGVGFNHDLTARENVVLNGVMMGLTPKQMRQRLEAIIEFAELEGFVDLKLKNYSSGMLVRLAFSVMMQADADVLLIDEVLAVGDASFQQKCADAFHEMKAAGKTIVLVTHEMETVEDYCHRAMLISDGLIQRIGDPGEIGREYLRLNFEQESKAGPPSEEATESEEVRVLDARIEASDGSRVSQVEHGEPIRLALELEVKRDLPGLDVGFLLANADGVGVFNFGIPVGEAERKREVAAGQRVTVRAELENSLVAGRYFVHCGINRAFEGGIALYVQNAVDFLVFGGPQTRGVVYPEVRIEAAVEEEKAG